VTGRRGRRHKELRDDFRKKEKILKTERRSAGQLALEEATDLS
jgi:hypothetical protein